MAKPHPIDLHVGKRLRQRRLSTRVSRVGLAKAAGISLQQLHKYERGADRIASSRLFRFAELLGVSVDFFFAGLPENGRAKVHSNLSPAVERFVESVEADDRRIHREVSEFVRAYYAITSRRSRATIAALVKSLVE